ncbi:hypothetical protein OAH36_03110 [Verrucomicrobia bacterium]|jgi:hypothetical protein|nr:hypothetical protein [Verrucomicrobiota bacterium]MDB4798567.1 hypothetical protein [Verrucomicrobiota bacterium]
MSTPTDNKEENRLDLSRWASLPNKLIVGGALVAIAGIVIPSWQKTFAYSYLTAYMFFLSIVLGSLFLVLVHHLFDTYWIVPIRRFLEHIACSIPVLILLFIPIAVFAGSIYPWMSVEGDHLLEIKSFMYNRYSFYIMAAALFAVWYWLSNGLRNASLEQDKTGAVSCTDTMRRYSAIGIFIFAFSLTFAVFYWMKSLEYQWFSTMYGVYYFAGSVWTTLATTYVIAFVLKKTGHLAPIIQHSTFKDIGTLFFAFTVFYAYIHFSQYFLIWNAAIPEETYWYVKRENGVWWSVGMLILFGHFFVPFLSLLRIDAKHCLPVMVPMAVWAWLMHYADMSFNIKPVYNPTGEGITFASLVLSVGSMALMAGVFAKWFLKEFNAHPAFPQRDPRVAETLAVYVEPASASSVRSNND